MTTHEINAFVVILEAKLAEAARRPQRRESIAVETNSDELNQIEGAVARDIAIQNVDGESRLLRDIRDALHRASEGTFGTCMHCEDAISHRRLAGVPWRDYASDVRRSSTETTRES